MNPQIRSCCAHIRGLEDQRCIFLLHVIGFTTNVKPSDMVWKSDGISGSLTKLCTVTCVLHLI